MSTSTNALYVWGDSCMVRVPPHACLCDECKLIDAQDAVSLRLAHEYLDGKLNVEDWWDAQIRNAVGDLDVAINRFHYSIDAKDVPLSLADSIDFLYYSFNEFQRGPFNEKRLRDLLECLIEGYETRMRTVHLWKRTAPKSNAE